MEMSKRTNWSKISILSGKTRDTDAENILEVRLIAN